MRLNNLLCMIATVLLATPALAQPEEIRSKAAASENGIAASTDAPSARITAPMLNIMWSCGKCEPNEKVPPLIDEAYRAAAAKDGRSVSETETAEVKIYSFQQRNPGLRVMLGAMGGQDSLSIRLTYKDKELSVSDYSANAVQGMNHLCESVGRKAYEGITDLKRWRPVAHEQEQDVSCWIGSEKKTGSACQ